MSAAPSSYLPDAEPLKVLAPTDAPAVFDLFSRCGDFFLLQDGQLPTPADAEELFTDVPPSKRPEDQHIFGLYRDGRLDALAALLADYPSAGQWYVGLLLVDPRSRGKRVGRELYARLEKWATAFGAKRMLIGVLRENGAAYRFWRSLGFEHVRSVGPRAFKGKEHLLDELAREPGGIDTHGRFPA